MSLNCTAKIAEGLDAMTRVLIVITAQSVYLPVTGLCQSVIIPTYHPGLLFSNLPADSALLWP